jgi:glycogen(starch) synthase
MLMLNCFSIADSSNQMKVLHLTRNFPPRVNGGISIAVEGMVKALIQEGVECQVLSFDGWRPRENRQVYSSIIVEQYSIDVKVIRVSGPERVEDAIDLVDEFRPGVLHVHNGMLWPVAERIRSNLDIPAIKTVHVVQKQLNDSRGITEVTNSLEEQEKAFRSADAVIAPTNEVASYLLKEYPSLKSRLCTIGFGIEDRLPLRPQEKVDGPIIYVGRFADIKGTADFFSIIPRIINQFPGTQFVVAGGLPDSPKKETRWRRIFIDSIPRLFHEYVTFTGWLNRQQLDALYSRARVLVVPSRVESFGLVALEGMSFGLPVVATKCSGLVELINHGVNGLLSEPGDIDALVDNIAILLRDRRYAISLGEKAAMMVRKRHLWSMVAPKIINLYLTCTQI